ncbi:hypothetical protein FACS189426_18550 [Bacteroidia bacterium]|nr:hypothetical protein FACS189426_18550 [Bacteroidia bacterium]GHV71356.1 hypothetical protein FACS189420_6170 [Bacteroidia bacterium]
MAITYATLSTAFANVKKKSVKEVGQIIGGKVEQNIKNGSFQNACAIRLSYALNKVGISITSKDGAVSSGKDGKKYLYRVNEVENFIKSNLYYTEILSGTNSSDFKEKQGIIIFRKCGWGDASGHIDLYDGKNVEDHDYSTTCGQVILYVLP